MKKLQSCEVENCIPTPSSCVAWNGGTIEYLGICDGDSLNILTWEIVKKLEEITGEDLSSFDIDSLTEICNQKAPNEITILSILNLLKANQVCLKNFIDNLQEQLGELFQESSISINLKCYAEFDNLGNSLSITRDQLDQLVLDNLCNHKQRIESLEGGQISLQNQIDNLDIPDTTEPTLTITCSALPSLSHTVAPTSSQVIALAKDLCELESVTGTGADVTSALAQTPSYPTAVTTDPDYIASPSTLAENYNNLLIAFGNALARLTEIENNCCALTCKDIELGFTAIYNEDMDGIIIKFTAGAGTFIPAGFTDVGSTGVITDKNGNTQTFNIIIANNSEDEISVAGLDLTGDLQVDITAIMSNEALTCEKCLHRIVKSTGCGFCEICATGSTGASLVVVYETETGGDATLYGTTTTSTTTTTTTIAP